MKSFPLAVLAALVLSAVLAPTALAAHTWGNYHWAQASDGTPNVRVQLADSLTDTGASKWKTLFSKTGAVGATGAAGPTVVQAWSRLDLTEPSTYFANALGDILDTPFIAGRNLASPKQCRPVAGQVEVCNARYGRTGWLGLAQVWTSGGHIVQATAKMNDTYFDDTRSFPVANQVARQHVLCQEVGHAFGLGHQDESGKDFETCMDYDSANSNAQPNQHDNHTIHAIYTGHADGGTTTTSTATSTGQVKRVAKDLYIEDRGNGRKVFTFVTWTDERTSQAAPNDRVPE